MSQETEQPHILILRHVPGNSLAHMAQPLTEMGLKHRYLNNYDLSPADYPDAASIDGLVILGGFEHIQDIEKTPQMQAELAFVQQVIERGTPVFGICLGAQLIARALGGGVCQNPVPEKGWIAIELTQAGQDDPVFSNLGSPHLQFHWHEDTYELPAGAVQLARTEDCEQQAFRYKDHVYAVQFHPEISINTIQAWISQSRSITDKGAAELLAETQKIIARRQAANRAMFSRFLRCVY